MKDATVDMKVPRRCRDGFKSHDMDFKLDLTGIAHDTDHDDDNLTPEYPLQEDHPLAIQNQKNLQLFLSSKFPGDSKSSFLFSTPTRTEYVNSRTAANVYANNSVSYVQAQSSSDVSTNVTKDWLWSDTFHKELPSQGENGIDAAWSQTLNLETTSKTENSYADTVLNQSSHSDTCEAKSDSLPCKTTMIRQNTVAMDSDSAISIPFTDTNNNARDRCCVDRVNKILKEEDNRPCVFTNENKSMGIVPSVIEKPDNDPDKKGDYDDVNKSPPFLLRMDQNDPSVDALLTSPEQNHPPTLSPVNPNNTLNKSTQPRTNSNSTPMVNSCPVITHASPCHSRHNGDEKFSLKVNQESRTSVSPLESSLISVVESDKEQKINREKTESVSSESLELIIDLDPSNGDQTKQELENVADIEKTVTFSDSHSSENTMIETPQNGYEGKDVSSPFVTTVPFIEKSQKDEGHLPFTEIPFQIKTSEAIKSVPSDTRGSTVITEAAMNEAINEPNDDKSEISNEVVNFSNTSPDSSKLRDLVCDVKDSHISNEVTSIMEFYRSASSDDIIVRDPLEDTCLDTDAPLTFESRQQCDEMIDTETENTQSKNAEVDLILNNCVTEPETDIIDSIFGMKEQNVKSVTRSPSNDNVILTINMPCDIALLDDQRLQNVENTDLQLQTNSSQCPDNFLGVENRSENVDDPNNMAQTIISVANLAKDIDSRIPCVSPSLQCSKPTKSTANNSNPKFSLSTQLTLVGRSIPTRCFPYTLKKIKGRAASRRKTVGKHSSKVFRSRFKPNGRSHRYLSYVDSLRTPIVSPMLSHNILSTHSFTLQTRRDPLSKNHFRSRSYTHAYAVKTPHHLSSIAETSSSTSTGLLPSLPHSPPVSTLPMSSVSSTSTQFVSVPLVSPICTLNSTTFTSAQLVSLAQSSKDCTVQTSASAASPHPSIYLTRSSLLSTAPTSATSAHPSSFNQSSPNISASVLTSTTSTPSTFLPPTVCSTLTSTSTTFIAESSASHLVHSNDIISSQQVSPSTTDHILPVIISLQNVTPMSVLEPENSPNITEQPCAITQESSTRLVNGINTTIPLQEAPTPMNHKLPVTTVLEHVTEQSQVRPQKPNDSAETENCESQLQDARQHVSGLGENRETEHQTCYQSASSSQPWHVPEQVGIAMTDAEANASVSNHMSVDSISSKVGDFNSRQGDFPVLKTCDHSTSKNQLWHIPEQNTETATFNHSSMMVDSAPASSQPSSHEEIQGTQSPAKSFETGSCATNRQENASVLRCRDLSPTPSEDEELLSFMSTYINRKGNKSKSTCENVQYSLPSSIAIVRKQELFDLEELASQEIDKIQTTPELQTPVVIEKCESPVFLNDKQVLTVEDENHDVPPDANRHEPIAAKDKATVELPLRDFFTTNPDKKSYSSLAQAAIKNKNIKASLKNSNSDDDDVLKFLSKKMLKGEDTRPDNDNVLNPLQNGEMIDLTSERDGDEVMCISSDDEDDKTEIIDRDLTSPHRLEHGVATIQVNEDDSIKRDNTPPVVKNDNETVQKVEGDNIGPSPVPVPLVDYRIEITNIRSTENTSDQETGDKIDIKSDELIPEEPQQLTVIDPNTIRDHGVLMSHRRTPGTNGKDTVKSLADHIKKRALKMSLEKKAEVSAKIHSIIVEKSDLLPESMRTQGIIAGFSDTSVQNAQPHILNSLVDGNERIMDEHTHHVNYLLPKKDTPNNRQGAMILGIPEVPSPVSAAHACSSMRVSVCPETQSFDPSQHMSFTTSSDTRNITPHQVHLDTSSIQYRTSIISPDGSLQPSITTPSVSTGTVDDTNPNRIMYRSSNVSTNGTDSALNVSNSLNNNTNSNDLALHLRKSIDPINTDRSVLNLSTERQVGSYRTVWCSQFVGKNTPTSDNKSPEFARRAISVDSLHNNQDTISESNGTQSRDNLASRLKLLHAARVIDPAVVRAPKTTPPVSKLSGIASPIVMTSTSLTNNLPVHLGNSFEENDISGPVDLSLNNKAIAPASQQNFTNNTPLRDGILNYSSQQESRVIVTNAHHRMVNNNNSDNVGSNQLRRTIEVLHRSPVPIPNNQFKDSLRQNQSGLIEHTQSMQIPNHRPIFANSVRNNQVQTQPFMRQAPDTPDHIASQRAPPMLIRPDQLQRPSGIPFQNRQNPVVNDRVVDSFAPQSQHREIITRENMDRFVIPSGVNVNPVLHSMREYHNTATSTHTDTRVQFPGPPHLQQHPPGPTFPHSQLRENTRQGNMVSGGANVNQVLHATATSANAKMHFTTPPPLQQAPPLQSRYPMGLVANISACPVQQRPLLQENSHPSTNHFRPGLKMIDNRTALLNPRFVRPTINFPTADYPLIQGNKVLRLPLPTLPKHMDTPMSSAHSYGNSLPQQHSHHGNGAPSQMVPNIQSQRQQPINSNNIPIRMVYPSHSIPASGQHFHPRAGSAFLPGHTNTQHLSPNRPAIQPASNQVTNRLPPASLPHLSPKLSKIPPIIIHNAPINGKVTENPEYIVKDGITYKKTNVFSLTNGQEIPSPAKIAAQHFIAKAQSDVSAYILEDHVSSSPHKRRKRKYTQKNSGHHKKKKTKSEKNQKDCEKHVNEAETPKTIHSSGVNAPAERTTVIEGQNIPNETTMIMDSDPPILHASFENGNLNTSPVNERLFIAEGSNACGNDEMTNDLQLLDHSIDLHSPINTIDARVYNELSKNIQPVVVLNSSNNYESSTSFESGNLNRATESRSDSGFSDSVSSLDQIPTKEYVIHEYEEGGMTFLSCQYLADVEGDGFSQVYDGEDVKAILPVEGIGMVNSIIINENKVPIQVDNNSCIPQGLSSLILASQKIEANVDKSNPSSNENFNRNNLQTNTCHENRNTNRALPAVDIGKSNAEPTSITETSVLSGVDVANNDENIAVEYRHKKSKAGTYRDRVTEGEKQAASMLLSMLQGPR